MSRFLYLIAMFSIVLALVLGGCSKERPHYVLFDGTNLSHWRFYIPGDSVDVNTVWRLKDGAIHCLGVPNGYMMTRDSFTNYKLHVEWRWVDQPGNSGVLLHCQGPDQVWPNCIEAQLKSGNAGDFVLIGPGSLTVNGEKKINTERFLTIKKKMEGIEKSPGEWNSYDITCKNDQITVVVNGTLQNHGIEAFVSSGPIALQSEGAPIEFRNIYLELL